MKDTAPSMQEIKEVQDLFANSTHAQLCEMKFFDDKRKLTIVKKMTGILMSNADDKCREKIWALCKKLNSFSHAPVTPKEYQRMAEFAKDTEIVDVVFNSLSANLYPFTGNPNEIGSLSGYFYCVALLSQADYRRDEIISLLQKIVDYIKANDAQSLFVMERNMDKLKPSYPDLARITFV